jgi:ferredoxin/flavodoxin---NADP+ reductase
MRGVSVRIVDSLPELGGQLMALYPEKYIFDVGGFPKVLAKDLALDLIAQAMQFEPEVLLDEEVRDWSSRRTGSFAWRGDGDLPPGPWSSPGGRGPSSPGSWRCPGYDDFLGKGVHYAVKDPEAFRGKRSWWWAGGIRRWTGPSS